MAGGDQFKQVGALSISLSSLKRDIEAQLAKQKRLSFFIALSGVEIGRLICQYAETPEVKAAVDQINREKQERGEGGRARADHCFVAEQLCASGLKISQHWLEQCARAFKRIEERGAKIDTPVRELLKKENTGGEIQKAEPQPAAVESDVIQRLEAIEALVEGGFKHAEAFWRPITDKITAWFAARGIRVKFHFNDEE